MDGIGKENDLPLNPAKEIATGRITKILICRPLILAQKPILVVQIRSGYTIRTDISIFSSVEVS